jgi:DNA-binding NarL/FixJ family response regulator
MACVLALVADLLFGSRVQGALTVAGHQVELIGDRRSLGDRLADDAAPPPGVLVVDLTDEDLDGAAVVESLSRDGGLERTRTLGFYSHVDAPARERAEQAGFDLVVPRSRMAREGAELVARLLAPAA